MTSYNTVLDAARGILDSFAKTPPAGFVDILIQPIGVVITSDTIELAVRAAVSQDALRKWDTTGLRAELSGTHSIGTRFVVYGIRQRQASAYNKQDS